VLYFAARKAAKEIVKSGVTALEDIQANLASLQSQEAGFDNYYRDCHLPQVAQEVGSFVRHNQSSSQFFQESFHSLSHFYPSMLQALGPLRAEKINAASTTLQENAPRRQEALKKFSKNARHQLEEARRNERDAADAAKLITHVKNLLLA
jgi:hypothetical protein